MLRNELICGNCEKCGLYNNQFPLFEDGVDTADVMWVGLSAKMIKDKDDMPLTPLSNSGAIVKKIEAKVDAKFYHTNLVKCVPLKDGKLRYPTSKEMKYCIENLLDEIKTINPKIVVLLGSKVMESVEKQLGIEFEDWDGFNYSPINVNGTYFIAIHHPSYFCIYKRKFIGGWINKVARIIRETIHEK